MINEEIDPRLPFFGKLSARVNNWPWIPKTAGKALLQKSNELVCFVHERWVVTPRNLQLSPGIRIRFREGRCGNETWERNGKSREKELSGVGKIDGG